MKNQKLLRLLQQVSMGHMSFLFLNQQHHSIEDNSPDSLFPSTSNDDADGVNEHRQSGMRNIEPTIINDNLALLRILVANYNASVFR